MSTSAERFAEEGARVVICGLGQKAGESAIKDIGRDIEFYRLDLTDKVSV